MSSASKGEKQINKHNGILHIFTKKRYMQYPKGEKSEK